MDERFPRTLFNWECHLSRCFLFSLVSRAAFSIIISSEVGGATLSPRAAVLSLGGWAEADIFFGEGVGGCADHAQPCDAAVPLVATAGARIREDENTGEGRGSGTSGRTKI